MDSGYSVDNLSPAAPFPKAASKAGGRVTIEWTASEDNDFDYFRVYRGTTEYFDAAASTPIARIVDTKYTDDLSTTGEKYYYQITAVDFSGNESNSSEEISEDNVITSVDDIQATPVVFGLQQNYPNPFNPTTRIRYQLPKNVKVSIMIYNILGTKVKALVDANESAGYHEIEWDGRDEFGRAVSSGVYIYRIMAGNFSDSKKMIFMK